MDIPLMKVLPHNLEAEQCILGSILIDRECITLVLDAKISEADFYATQNREIFASIIDLFTLDKPVDVVTV